MSILKKHPFFFTALLLIMGPAALNVSGFCWSKPGWLSEKELIQHEVTYLINKARIRVVTPDRGWQHYPQIKKYRNAEDFLKKNPHFCEAGRHLKGDYWPPTFLDRITGRWGYPVEIRGALYYSNEHENEKTEAIKIQQVLNNCGQHPF